LASFLVLEQVLERAQEFLERYILSVVLDVHQVSVELMHHHHMDFYQSFQYQLQA
jgi:hypothetical protein